MPKDLLSVNLIICERILAEGDSVLSVIRMVDIFFVDPAVVGPDTEDRIQMQVLLATKFSASATREHMVEFKLARPEGEPVSMGGLRPVTVESKFQDAPAGFTTVINAGVKLKQMGTHYLIAYVDGDEVARTTFTLLPPLTPKTD
jgi:hypothetical protein